MARGQFPKAYLRVDPNLDVTHSCPGEMLALMCAANRQPHRGRFKNAALAERVLGRGLFRRCVQRGDLIRIEAERLYVDGWDEWQEGDHTVGERMQRLRDKRNGVTNEP